jgi:hypothetical protein
MVLLTFFSLGTFDTAGLVPGALRIEIAYQWFALVAFRAGLC